MPDLLLELFSEEIPSSPTLTAAASLRGQEIKDWHAGIGGGYRHA